MGSCGSKPEDKTKTKANIKPKVQFEDPALSKQRTTKDKAGTDMEEGISVPLAGLKNNSKPVPNPN